MTTLKHKKPGFSPIGADEYIDLYLKANPDTSRSEIEKGLQLALSDHKRGVKCQCGNPLWVVGSAVAGNGCFTCITGQAAPDDDYEIDEAMKWNGERADVADPRESSGGKS